MATKFYKCNHCGNVIIKTVDSGVPVLCCGEKMVELGPKTVDASQEKHVPVVTRVDDCRIKVEVGSVPHPMTEEHLIEWVALETEQGYQVKKLSAGSEPVCTFTLADGDKAVAVYAYCNLHGLWQV